MGGFHCAAAPTRKDTEQSSHCSSRLPVWLNEGRKMQALESEVDIMTALKAGTIEQHASIERIMPFFKDDFSLESYIRVLKAFLGFFEPVEFELRSIATRDSFGFNIDRRQRTNLLRMDLLALGVTPADMELIPKCDHLPRLENVDDGIGCLYVLEGSTLGGQLIARELQTRFGVEEKSGSQFFHGYGSQTGLKWREFCTSVRIYTAGGKSQLAIVQSARSTFESLESWMRKANFSE
jgi:heme oxygenase (biliverdin-IX-beta and delta-forming)